MGNTHEYLAGVTVPLGNKGLECLTQGFVSGFVSLHNSPRSFVENQQVIVLVQDSVLQVPELLRAHFPIYSHS